MKVEVVSRRPGTIEPGDLPDLQGPCDRLHERPLHEGLDAEDLPVIAGTVPRDIDGVCLRNTQNPLHQALKRDHSFDGHGMLHRAAFRDGFVSDRNRFIRTEGLMADTAAGRRRWPGLMEDLSLAQPLIDGKRCQDGPVCRVRPPHQLPAGRMPAGPTDRISATAAGCRG
jgi:carotenoid cleavage dioxygenase